MASKTTTTRQEDEYSQNRFLKALAILRLDFKMIKTLPKQNIPKANQYRLSMIKNIRIEDRYNSLAFI